MAKPLRFHPDVADDIHSAELWYAARSEALAESFRELVDARFDDIEEQPHLFGVAFEGARFTRVKRFPYIVLFQELEDEVFVLGVFHGSSDPNKWRSRMERD